MGLPIMTSPEDVETVISYLKTKVTGATVAEAKSALDPKLLDYRKISAYTYWGFILKDNDKLRLSETGRELSRTSSERKASLYSAAIRRIGPYRMAIEWIFYQKFDEISNVELASHWHEHCPEELGSETEATIRSQAACFFGLAQAAGLGRYFLGRRDRPTRLEVSLDALGQFIGETGLHSSGDIVQDQDTIDVELNNDVEVVETEVYHNGSSASNSLMKEEATRVFISHSKNLDIVDQIKTMLEINDIDYEIAVEEETTAIPVPEKVLSAMRRCSAAAICVTADEQSKRDNGTYSINENVLIEIGAAFVLYDKKVILVWDRRIPVPSNLQGLYRCEFEGAELSWSAGMKLMKALTNFKKDRVIR